MIRGSDVGGLGPAKVTEAASSGSLSLDLSFFVRFFFLVFASRLDVSILREVAFSLNVNIAVCYELQRENSNENLLQSSVGTYCKTL